MKTAIPWVLVVLLLGGVYFLYSSNNAERAAQSKKLDDQAAELESLHTQIDELKKHPPAEEELSRLRKDNTELLKLRSEVQQLRAQNKQIGAQLSTAQAQNSQAEKMTQAQLAQLASENQALRKAAPVPLPPEPGTRTPAQEQASACINNLRIIDGAKQTWALENKKTADAEPTYNDIAPYLPPNSQLACPAGGTYTINAMNVLPTCSIPGHVLR